MGRFSAAGGGGGGGWVVEDETLHIFRGCIEVGFFVLIAHHCVSNFVNKKLGENQNRGKWGLGIMVWEKGGWTGLDRSGDLASKLTCAVGDGVVFSARKKKDEELEKKRGE